MAFDRCRRLPALKIAVALVALAGAGLLTSGTAASAGAQPAPWCANMGGRDGGWDCGYYTFDQCMATAQGAREVCVQNPRRFGRRSRRRGACANQGGSSGCVGGNRSRRSRRSRRATTPRRAQLKWAARGRPVCTPRGRNRDRGQPPRTANSPCRPHALARPEFVNGVVAGGDDAGPAAAHRRRGGEVAVLSRRAIAGAAMRGTLRIRRDISAAK